MTTQNEPQLSAEMEEKFEQMWTEGTGLHDRAKHFLATALEERSIDTIEKINKSFYENELSTAIEEQRADYVRKVEKLYCFVENCDDVLVKKDDLLNILKGKTK